MYKLQKRLLVLPLLTPLTAILAPASQAFRVQGVPDAKIGYECAISAGSNTLTCQDLKFVPTDVGQTINVYGAVENVNTTSSTELDPGTVTVTPESMANITVGEALWVEDANGDNAEGVQVSAVNGSSFTAKFTHPKSGTWSIVTDYVSLYTTITSYASSSTVTLSTSASKTVSAAMTQVVGKTDNNQNITNVLNSACAAATASNPSIVSFPAGVYGFFSSLTIPNGCSNLTLTSIGGKVVLLAEGIASTDPTNVRYGQGGGVFMFGTTTGLGRSTAKASDHTTIVAGTNLLSCDGCQFRTSDIGSSIWVAYAAGGGLPLWTTITGVSGTPSDGIYPSAVLANDAAISLPLTAPGLAGPLVSIGFQIMKNIEISNIDLQNFGMWFHPLSSKAGIPLINFGYNGNIVKKGITFQNSTITSATNGCIANNGPLTQFLIENITCLGATDAAIYMAGDSNNGTVKNVSVDNTGYPTATSLSNGYLMNNVNVSVITDASVKCNCFFATFEIGDYPNFNLTVENSHLDGNGTTPVGIGSNITSGLSVLNSTIENVQFAFRFANVQASSIEGVTMTGNTILNANSAYWSIDTSGSGYGPGNITFENNNAQVTANGITALNAGGTNTFSKNILTHEGSKGAFAWDVSGGKPTGMNSVDSNKVSGFSSGGSCSPAPRCN